MQKPPVIILAGGSNSRFFPFNSTTHKGALVLHGQTLISRTLTNLKAHGFQEVVIVISPRDQTTGSLKTVVDECNQKLKLNITYALQPEAKGMGDAVLKGLTQLTNQKFSQLAVLSPYHVTAGDLLDGMLLLGETCLCTSETDNSPAYGMVHFTDDGKADQIVEKPAKGTEPSNQKVLSLYLVSRDFIETLKQVPTEECSFEHALDKFLQKNPAPTLRLPEPLATLKYPWDLFSFQKIFFDQLTSFRSPKANIADTAVIDESHGPVWIEAGATIGHSSRIVGPTYIGKDVLIGDFCLVRESSLEEKVKIGAHSEIARSIFMASSTIHRGYVGDSIIGIGTKLGAGFLTANKRFDRKAIPVTVKGKLVNSGKTALGVLIGDQTQIGTRVNTMPGKCIGNHVTIFPGTIVYENVADNETLTPLDSMKDAK